MSTVLIPYFELPHEEREAIHQWLTDHHVDYTQVPVGWSWEFDESTGEWRIPIYLRRNGRPYLNDNREIASGILRRVEKRPLPWAAANA